jgi:hypothetical protein
LRSVEVKEPLPPWEDDEMSVAQEAKDDKDDTVSNARKKQVTQSRLFASKNKLSASSQEGLMVESEISSQNYHVWIHHEVDGPLGRPPVNGGTHTRVKLKHRLLKPAPLSRLDTGATSQAEHDQALNTPAAHIPMCAQAYALLANVVPGRCQCLPINPYFG